MKILELLVCFFLSSFVSCAQPLDTKTISFYLSDEIEQGYTLCNPKDSIPDTPKIHVPNRYMQNTFTVSDLFGSFFTTLVLYSEEDKMIIHIVDFEQFEKNRFELGKIPFKKGRFVLNFNRMSPSLQSKFDWENCRLHILDSQHYYQNIRAENTTQLETAITYTKDITPIKWTYFDNGNINVEMINTWFNNYIYLNYFNNSQTGMPKTYISNYEKIEIDSLGYIKSRYIYDKDCQDSYVLKKSYKQLHQVGKYYQDIKSSLPMGMLHQPEIYQTNNANFMALPVIYKGKYSLAISRAGYFPQDSIDTHKFKAYNDSIILKITFYSGADQIGKSVVLKDISENEVQYNIYLFETKASSDFEWERTVFIPLGIDSNKKHEIHFPIKVDVSLLPSKEFDFAPRWILSDTNLPVYEPIEIYGCYWNGNN